MNTGKNPVGTFSEKVKQHKAQITLANQRTVTQTVAQRKALFIEKRKEMQNWSNEELERGLRLISRTGKHTLESTPNERFWRQHYGWSYIDKFRSVVKNSELLAEKIARAEEKSQFITPADKKKAVALLAWWASNLYKPPHPF